MMLSYIKSSLVAAAWFVFLTFPFMVIKVNTLKDTVEWRWLNMLWVAVAAFVLQFLDQLLILGTIVDVMGISKA